MHIYGRKRNSELPVGPLHHSLQVGLVLFQVFLFLYLLELCDHCGRLYHLVSPLLSLQMQELHISQTRKHSKRFLISDINTATNKLYLILGILLYLLKVGLVRCFQYMFIKRGFALLHFFLPLCQQLELLIDKRMHWYEKLEHIIQKICRSWPLCSKFSSCILPIHSYLVWVRLHVPAGKFSKTTQVSFASEYKQILYAPSYIYLGQLLPVGLHQGFHLVLNPLYHKVQLLSLLSQVLDKLIICNLQVLLKTSLLAFHS